MIHELRTYTLAQGALSEYIELQRALARPIRGDRYGRLLEYWTATSGESSRVVHLWEYASFEDRLRLRAELAANPRWKDEYSPHSHPLIERQENAILMPVPEWDSPHHASSDSCELRFITLRAGGVPEWIASARAEPADSPSRPARAWTVEVGQLNTVVGLWPGSRAEDPPPLLSELTLSTFVLGLRATALAPSRAGGLTQNPATGESWEQSR